MSNILLLAVCFALGALLRRTGHAPEATPAVLGAWIIQVALPATILRHVPSLNWESSLAFAGLIPWVAFGATVALVALLRPIFGWDRRTAACLMLVAGLGNTSFLGLPICEALYGVDAIPIALVADQVGSFLTLSTLGLVVLAWGDGAAVSVRSIGRRIFTFTPFWALVGAVVLRFTPVVPGPALDVLSRLSATLGPLALFSVGYQLQLGDLRARLRDVSIGLGIRLVFAPAIALFIACLLGLGGLVGSVTIVEAGMPPMITAGILAADRRLDGPLAGLLVAFGIPVSVITIALWYFAAQWLLPA
jgi:hypothetical protein